MPLNEQLSDYAIGLAAFEGKHRLTPRTLGRPDHIALRAGSIHQFESMVRSLNKSVEQMTCVEGEDDGRFIVDAKVLGAFSLGDYDRTSWLEILEPDPDQVSSDLPSLPYAQFYSDDFGRVLSSFESHNVTYGIQFLRGSRIAYAISSFRGHYFEVRVSDTPIEAVVDEEVRNNDAYLLAA